MYIYNIIYIYIYIYIYIVTTNESSDHRAQQNYALCWFN